MEERENPNLESAIHSYRKTWETLPGDVPRRGDAEIKSDLESALFRDPAVRSYQVTVDVRDGVITLSGTVDDNLALMAAEDHARAVPGAREVRNNLRVRSPAMG